MYENSPKAFHGSLPDGVWEQPAGDGPAVLGHLYLLSIPILHPAGEGSGTSWLSTENTLLSRNGAGNNSQNSSSWCFLAGLAGAGTRMLCSASHRIHPSAQTRLWENALITRTRTAQFCNLLFFPVALSPSVSNNRAMNIQEKNVLKTGDIFRIGWR